MQIVFRARHIKQMFGISEHIYYRIVARGHLPYTRLYPGGTRVHLPDHVRQYEEYLRTQEVRRTTPAARS